MAPWLTPFFFGLLVTAGLLLPLLLRFRTSAGEANHRAAALERDAGELRRGRAQMEEDQRSVLQFLKEFPNLARDLFGGFAERQLPPTLLHVLQKSLDPAQALVLVRRGQEATDARFVVAAAYPEGGVPKVGTEMRLDRGEMGFVAESQLLASREDLATDEARRRIKPGPDPLGGLQPPLIAPLLFDIDHFKHYNDTNGHLPGDKLLQELVRVVQDGVRKDDIFGRFGGEEFLLILPNTTLDQALGAANKVREAIAARKFPFAEKQPMGILSISGGVAGYPHDGTDVVGLLRAAGAASPPFRSITDAGGPGKRA